MTLTSSVANLTQFLAGVGLVNARLQRIQAGRNSRVWRVEAASETYVVKEYFRHPADPRDRLSTEYGFLSFLQSQGITLVPKPIAQDPDSSYALYSYLPGAPVATIQSHHIEQAATFITQINRGKETAAGQKLPLASEACLALFEHLERVKLRLSRLAEAVVSGEDPGDNTLQTDVRALLANALWPTYYKIEQQIHTQLGIKLEQVLPRSEQILSPSDFGFHNMLEAGEQLYFLDFEYAGWDDPAKLLCDFVCQPQRPVSDEQGKAFAAYLSHLVYIEQAHARATLLLPLYRLKWCCILLNEFRSQDRQRREHAVGVQTDCLQAQLHKAQIYFNQHL